MEKWNFSIKFSKHSMDIYSTLQNPHIVHFTASATFCSLNDCDVCFSVFEIPHKYYNLNVFHCLITYRLQSICNLCCEVCFVSFFFLFQSEIKLL